MSDQRTDRELLEALIEGQGKLALDIAEVKKEMNNRFDDVEEKLKKLSQSQDILVKEIHENKVEINLLKNNQAS